jgi:hypothetical protein
MAPRNHAQMHTDLHGAQVQELDDQLEQAAFWLAEVDAQQNGVSVGLCWSMWSHEYKAKAITLVHQAAKGQ